MGNNVPVLPLTRLDTSSAVDSVNENFRRLSDALDRVLLGSGYRLSNSLDANGRSILNLPDATTPNQPVTLRQLLNNSGQPGIPGQDGADGRGISNVAINGSGHLIITFTDGTSTDVGLVVGGGGTTPVVSLNALAVSLATATVGSPFTATVSNNTSGSTLSLSGTGAAGLSISGTTISGTPTTVGAVNIVETLAGATNSPRTTSGAITVAAAPPISISAPQLTKTSTAGANPMTFDTYLPDDIDHTTNKVRGQLASDSGFTTNLVVEVVQLDENMVEGQSLPFNFLAPPMPDGPNYVRVREESSDGSVLSPWSNVIMDTFASSVNNGWDTTNTTYTFTQGNKIATRNSAGTSGIVRAPNGKTSGVGRYFEVTWTAAGGGDYFMMGLTSNATLAGDGETNSTDRIAFKSDSAWFADGSYKGAGVSNVSSGQTAGLYYYPDTNEVYSTDGVGGTRGPYAWDKAIAMFPFAFASGAGAVVKVNLTGPFLYNERGAQAWNA